MGVTKLTRTYHCWNDCQMGGCPGHTATLEYQSSSDALTFSDGKNGNIHMQTPELEAFLSMLVDLATSRSEIEDVVRKSLKREEGAQ